MKTTLFLLISLLATNFSFSQEASTAIEIPIRSNNSALPKNIFLSEDDRMILGASFTQKDNLILVNFTVTEQTLEFSTTNKYLVRYNKDLNEIEFGCLTVLPDGKGTKTIVNDVFSIPADKIGVPEDSVTKKGE